MLDEQPPSQACKRSRITRIAVQSGLEVDLAAVARGGVRQIRVHASVFVHRVGKLLAVRRIVSGVGFPLQIGDPAELLGGHINFHDVQVAAKPVGGDEQRSAIGRNRGGDGAAIAFVGRQIFLFAGGDVNTIGVRVSKSRAEARRIEIFAVGTPHSGIPEVVLGLFISEVADRVRGPIHHGDIGGGRCLGLELNR